MTKKIVIGVLVAAVLVLGVAATAFAQDPPPPDGSCPFGNTCDGSGYGRAGYGMRGRGMGGWGYRGAMPGVIAEALGMTVGELAEAAADGQTIADIAEAQGVALDDLVEALVAFRAEQLEQAVADGRLTQEQVDEMLAAMAEHMTDRLENSAPGGGSGPGLGRGGCGMAPRGFQGSGSQGGRGWGRKGR